MKKHLTAWLLLLSLLLLSGCSAGVKQSSAPVTLTLWHNFGGQMQTTMDALVDEFNNTVGKEKGIILSVTSISDSATIQEKLTMIAAGDPGAPDMPDIATCYPQTAALLAENKLIAPLDQQFNRKELSGYIPQFLEEGRLSDGKLYVFPIAKSTEVLFVNRTLFDRFSKATGTSIEELSTFESLSKAALKYYQWTDGQTPGTPHDGKSFFTCDSLFNLAQVGMRQMGADLFKEDGLNLLSPEHRRIWDCIYEPAVKGGYAIYDGYSSDLSKTGEIVCSTGSTAGILFYGSEIIYPDNTTEKVEYSILPFPVFEDGKKVAVQRGGGMVVAKSTPEKERAAAAFLKWFTAPEQNMRFVASTGYLPVTREAFTNSIVPEISWDPENNIQKSFMTALTVYQEYEFYIPPVFEGYKSLNENYDKDFERMAAEARNRYLKLLDTMPSEKAFAQATKGDFEAFSSSR